MASDFSVCVYGVDLHIDLQIIPLLLRTYYNGLLLEDKAIPAWAESPCPTAGVLCPSGWGQLRL